LIEKGGDRGTRNQEGVEEAQEKGGTRKGGEIRMRTGNETEKATKVDQTSPKISGWLAAEERHRVCGVGQPRETNLKRVFQKPLETETKLRGTRQTGKTTQQKNWAQDS